MSQNISVIYLIAGAGLGISVVTFVEMLALRYRVRALETNQERP